MKVELDDIVEALEIGSSEFTAYLNKASGAVVQLGEEYLSHAEADNVVGRPEWELEIIAEARDIVTHPEKYIKLPSGWDIQEYKIMEDFCYGCEDADKRERLLRSIKGKGAFRRFKDKADDLGALDDWYTYRLKALTDIAIEWCEENDVKLA